MWLRGILSWLLLQLSPLVLAEDTTIAINDTQQLTQISYIPNTIGAI